MVLNLGNDNSLITSKNTTTEEGIGGQNVTLIEDLSTNPLSSAGISAITMNHKNNSKGFFDFIDSNLSNYWTIQDHDAGPITSTITIDLSKILKINVAALQYEIIMSSGGGDYTAIKIEYSKDNTNWSTWFDETYNTGPIDEKDYNKYLFRKLFRYLKITIVTVATPAIEAGVELKYLKLNR